MIGDVTSEHSDLKSDDLADYLKFRETEQAKEKGTTKFDEDFGEDDPEEAEKKKKPSKTKEAKGEKKKRTFDLEEDA